MYSYFGISLGPPQSVTRDSSDDLVTAPHDQHNFFCDILDFYEIIFMLTAPYNTTTAGMQ